MCVLRHVATHTHTQTHTHTAHTHTYTHTQTYIRIHTDGARGTWGDQKTREAHDSLDESRHTHE